MIITNLQGNSKTLKPGHWTKEDYIHLPPILQFWIALKTSLSLKCFLASEIY